MLAGYEVTPVKTWESPRLQQTSSPFLLTGPSPSPSADKISKLEALVADLEKRLSMVEDLCGQTSDRVDELEVKESKIPDTIS